VRDEDGGQAVLLPQTFQFLLQFETGQRVERAKRLV
jgi:hypothetical protein